MTPKEAADFETAGNYDKVKEFFLAASARELQEFIHLKPAYTTLMTFNRARVALDIRLAEDVDISTKRIVWLTRFVAILTVVLVVLTAVLVFLTFKLAHHP
jgi:hypothetical protein